ncbi:helix-turn-helix transcriptional regulator [Streptomyces sp. UNOC14_S4]|uniref:helix-turn-helix domain-containing protein n=1 Tax=Streptomyces sp. UNOC14_S4 TaxID=2872340 RepID=UPI001E32A9EA|nr:helix-turn-helix transcriptional regulator [Streptomyces sp. UNOC14_S4]MCC3770947.1 helix-turn-helix transcriptional regulator [Streptomyces sp. UNOC14_S4]
MPISPSSRVQEARKSIAECLREIRLDAGLTGRELASRCGWHPSKSSRIENLKTLPSDADLRAWCAACGADDRAADLIAASRTADSMYMEWRRLERTGLRRLQQSYVPLYERTKLFRVYCSHVVPGLLQTPAYATALLSAITDFRRIPDDVEEAVSARMARSHVIREGDHRFVILLEEAVLRYRVGDASTMSGQLGHLLTMMALPRVALGIVPFVAERRMWTIEPFTIFDDEQAGVELLSADVTLTAPNDTRLYARAFAELQRLALYGAQARPLITAALGALG